MVMRERERGEEEKRGFKRGRKRRKRRSGGKRSKPVVQSFEAASVHFVCLRASD